MTFGITDHCVISSSYSVESVGIVVLDWGHAVLDDGVDQVVSGDVSNLSNHVWGHGVDGSGKESLLLSLFGLGQVLVGSWTWSWNPGLGWLESPLGADGSWLNISSDLSEVSILVDGVNSHVPFLSLLSGLSFGH